MADDSVLQDASFPGHPNTKLKCNLQIRCCLQPAHLTSGTKWSAPKGALEGAPVGRLGLTCPYRC
eukprot:1151450-Pelagomonas_calceolata.AAC.1